MRSARVAVAAGVNESPGEKPNAHSKRRCEFLRVCFDVGKSSNL